jgi:hypothetical protein
VLVDKADARTLKPNPLERPDYIEADVQSYRALAVGNATPDQQRRLLDHLINFVCCTYDMPYRPNQRDTDLALGKMLTGQHILWLLKTAPTKTDPTEIAARQTGEGEQ